LSIIANPVSERIVLLRGLDDNPLRLGEEVDPAAAAEAARLVAI
jgi:hypothetical protein